MRRLMRRWSQCRHRRLAAPPFGSSLDLPGIASPPSPPSRVPYAASAASLRHKLHGDRGLAQAEVPLELLLY